MAIRSSKNFFTGVTAILQNPSGSGKVDQGAVAKYANFIDSKASADGSIVDRQHDQSYNTAVAIVARAAGLSSLERLDLVHAVAIFAWANRLMLNLGEPVFPD